MRHETGFHVEAASLTRLPGFAAGTRVLTEAGERPIEALKRGEWVITRRGRAAVLSVEARAARVAPVRIVAEALGLEMPAQDLLVGPATKIWLPRQSKPMEAFRLVDGVFVSEERPRGMTLWTLVFWGAQTIRADGVEVSV